MDAVIAIIISIFILKTGAELGKEAILTLMDAVVKPDHIDKIRRLSEEVSGVIDVHDIKIRTSGQFCFGEMHIEVEEGLSVKKAHAITEEIEQKAKQECKELESLIIHMEPAKRKKLRIAIPIGVNNGLDSTINSHFSNASYFILVNVDNGQIQNWSLKANPGAELNKKRGITTAKFLINEKINTLLTIERGEGPFHLLRDSFVKIYKIKEKKNVRGIIEDLTHGKFEEF